MSTGSQHNPRLLQYPHRFASYYQGISHLHANVNVEGGVNTHTCSGLHGSQQNWFQILGAMAAKFNTPLNLAARAAQIKAYVFRGELTDSLDDNTFLLLTFGHTKQ